VISLGQGSEEIKVGLKYGQVCFAVPAASAFFEFEGKLVCPRQKSSGKEIVFQTDKGAKISFSAEERLVPKEGRTLVTKFPKMSLEIL